MPISHIKNVFNAGELSPKVWSRADLEKWHGGCKTLLNMLPIPQGGVVRRPGFECIKTAKNNNTPIRLIPFVFSTTQAYMLEFGPAYMRVYMNGGQAQVAGNGTALLMHFDDGSYSTNFYDSSSFAHNISVVGNAKQWKWIKKFGETSLRTTDIVDSYVYSADDSDWFHAANPFTIDAWIFPIDTGNRSHGIFAQYQDVGNFYELTHNHSTSKLSFVVKTGNTEYFNLNNTWSPTGYNWYHVAMIRGWGNNANNWALTVDGSPIATTANNYSMPDLAGNFQIGKSSNINHFGYIDEFRVSKGVARWTEPFSPPVSEYPGADASGVAAEISTNYTSADLSKLQFVQSYDTMYITHQNHAPAQLLRQSHTSWNLSDIVFANNSTPSEWSNNNGWPRACAFYQDRLAFAGSTTFPSRLWFSKTGNYTDLTTGANDNDGMKLNLLSGTSDTIFWLASGQSLLCGTDTGIQSIAAANGSNAALTPTNKKNYKESYFGSGEVGPVELGDLVLHVGNPASKVRELGFNWQRDGFGSVELSVLADHLFEGYAIEEMAYQQSPNEVVWCRRSDGNMVAITYMQDQQVSAWSQHASGNILSIATIPGQTETELWAAIEREINGNNVTTIERMSPFEQKDFNNSLFLDSYKQHNGAATTTLNGLDHLNGQNNITYLADGVIGTANVANNSIAVANNSTVITAGLAYNSTVETLPVEIETQAGASMFEEKRITEIAIRCRNSAGGTYGPDSNYQTALYENNALTNGVKKNLSLRGGYDPVRFVVIQQTDPLPLNIDAIGMEVEVN
jgi:hypothetical protein